MGHTPTLFLDVLNKLNMKLIMHTFYKTAYLLVVWGLSEISDIMISAHHKSLKEAESHQKDAPGLLATVKIHNDPMGHVSHWRSVQHDNHTNHNSLNTSSVPYQKPLIKLVGTSSTTNSISQSLIIKSIICTTFVNGLSSGAILLTQTVLWGNTVHH
jgi:hypothetical protein